MSACHCKISSSDYTKKILVLSIVKLIYNKYDIHISINSLKQHKFIANFPNYCIIDSHVLNFIQADIKAQTPFMA
jgi:hypothetical protein